MEDFLWLNFLLRTNLKHKFLPPPGTSADPVGSESWARSTAVGWRSSSTSTSSSSGLRCLSLLWLFLQLFIWIRPTCSTCATTSRLHKVGCQVLWTFIGQFGDFFRNYPPREKTPPGESSGPPVEEEVQVTVHSVLTSSWLTPVTVNKREIHNVVLQVEERLVGAVLGPAGRYVEEIKQYRYDYIKSTTDPALGQIFQ